MGLVGPEQAQDEILGVVQQVRGRDQQWWYGKVISKEYEYHD